MKILIIDDTVELLEELSDLLKMEGYEVETASDGYTGINIVNESLPDLIITDLDMPEMGGFDLISKIRSIHRSSTRIPIIVLSGQEEESDVRKAFKLDADLFLKKPASAEEIIGSIESVSSWKK